MARTLACERSSRGGRDEATPKDEKMSVHSAEPRQRHRLCGAVNGRIVQLVTVKKRALAERKRVQERRRGRQGMRPSRGKNRRRASTRIHHVRRTPTNAGEKGKTDAGKTQTRRFTATSDWRSQLPGHGNRNGAQTDAVLCPLVLLLDLRLLLGRKVVDNVEAAEDRGRIRVSLGTRLTGFGARAGRTACGSLPAACP